LLPMSFALCMKMSTAQPVLACKREIGCGADLPLSCPFARAAAARSNSASVISEGLRGETYARQSAKMRIRDGMVPQMDTSTQGTRAYELKSQPIQNLSERAIAEMFDLVRNELQLARVEFDEKARAGVRAGQSLGVATICLVVALGAVGAAIGLGLSQTMTPWAAALVVAAIFGIVALALALSARATLARAGGLGTSATLDKVLPPSGLSAEDLERRTEAAQQDLDRTVNAIAIAQRNATPSPIRDAILAGIGTMLGVVLQARSGRR